MRLPSLCPTLSLRTFEPFADQGKLSQHLGALTVGESITISGPWGMHEYLGKGFFKTGISEVHCEKVHLTLA